jgi:hypothetical protein
MAYDRIDTLCSRNTGQVREESVQCKLHDSTPSVLAVVSVPITLSFQYGSFQSIETYLRAFVLVVVRIDSPAVGEALGKTATVIRLCAGAALANAR